MAPRVRRAHRLALLRALAMGALSAITACTAGPTPATSVLLDVRVGDGVTPPRFLVLNAWDEHGQAFRAQRLPQAGVIEAKTADLGSVVLYPGDAAHRLRVDVRGISSLGAVVAAGAIEVAMVQGKQVAATLVLVAGPPDDADGDGVSDPVDNCPDVGNPEQTDGDGDGVGDDCVGIEPGADGAVPGDGGDRPAGGDAGPPDRDGGGESPDARDVPADAGAGDAVVDAPDLDTPFDAPADPVVDPVVDPAIDPAIEGGPGTICASAGECTSGFCVDGRCCNAACDGPCQACDLPSSIGVCAAVRNADDPDTCTSAQTCSAGGACLLKQGFSCTGDAMQFTATSDSNPGSNRYVYWTFSLATHVVAAGDVIEYDTYIDQPLSGLGGIELYNSDATAWRDTPPWQDQNGISGHPSSDLSMRAFGQWYHRRLQVAPAQVGKTIARWLVVDENNGVGVTSDAYYDNIVVSNGGVVVFVAYQAGPPPASALSFQANYPTATLAVVPGPGAGGPGSCATGHCADGVCCDRGCGAPCRACNLAGSEGTCLAVDGTTDPPLCTSPSICTAGVCGADAGAD